MQKVYENNRNRSDQDYDQIAQQVSTGSVSDRFIMILLLEHRDPVANAPGTDLLGNLL